LRAAAARSAEARMDGPKMLSRDLVPTAEPIPGGFARIALGRVTLGIWKQKMEPLRIGPVLSCYAMR
jgi:hypothetical protein